MFAADVEAAPESCEQRRVEMRRADEALAAGFSEQEAWEFAVSTVDIGLLRRLVRDGCPAELLAKVLL